MESRQDFRAMLTRIDSELSKKDLEHLVFLCQSRLTSVQQDSIKTGHNLFEILERKELISVQNVKLLEILFKIIGRMDLLGKLLFKNDVENDSGGEIMTSVNEYLCPFSHVLFCINEELPQVEVESLRYLYGQVPRNVHISSALDLFKIMMKQKSISSDNLDCLKKLLETIERNDLVTLIDDFSRQRFESSVSSQSLGAGDSACANTCLESPNNQTVNQKTSPASTQSFQPVHSTIQTSVRTVVQQEQVEAVTARTPLKPEAAPLSLAQASSDDHCLSPPKPEAAQLSLPHATRDNPCISPFRAAPHSLPQAPSYNPDIHGLKTGAAVTSHQQAPSDDHHIGPLRPEAVPFTHVHETVQTSVKARSSYGREAAVSQSVSMESPSGEETTQGFNVRLISTSRSMSVPSGTPYNQTVSSSPAFLNSSSHENYTASTGEAAQISEEINLTNIPRERYKMTTEPRGICLVIDNDTFETRPGAEILKARRGSNIDAENLKQCFELLKFNVDIRKNLNLQETRDCFDTLSKLNHSSSDCFVCCILSHGCEGAIYCSDGCKLDVIEIISYFSPKRCPSLGGKPKLFFLSCCQGKTKPEAVFHPEASAIERDGPTSETKQVSPEMADFLIGYATFFGYASFRDTRKGTIYVESLTKILRNDYKEKHLLDMLVMVNDDISSQTLSLNGRDYQQVGAPYVSLRKQVWF